MKLFLKSAALSAIALLAPIHAMLATVGVLIVVDATLGVWAAKKRGEAISSAALRRTVSKLCIYHLSLISGFLVETYLIGGALPVAKLVASAIGLVEMKSILENSDEISGGSVFKTLIGKLGSANDKAGT